MKIVCISTIGSLEAVF